MPLNIQTDRSGEVIRAKITEISRRTKQIMSRGVVTPAVASSLLKGWHGRVPLCPNVGLSLGSSCAVVEVESSANSEASQDSTTDGNLSSSPPANGEPVKSPAAAGLERMDSGISVISAESEINNKNKEVFKRTESGKLPSSQYKGVVPQPNGRWGAQIYERHQRVWLGTFNGEGDAANAYDTAALKFRGSDAITNFAPLDDSHPQAIFLRRHSKSEIVDMLRKHTFQDELEQSIKNNSIDATDTSNSNNKVAGSSSSQSERTIYPPEHLFDKAVTPSDVGKLNRLVIPKQHAEKHFPIDIVSTGKGLLLNFEDAAGKTWRFRYSYWNSSQSYVLTKGWSRYVKEKHLEAGDIVTFERSTGGSRQLYISFRRSPCNDLSTAAYKPAAPGGFLIPRQLVSPFTGYRQWTHAFYSQSPVQTITVGHPPLPWAALPNSSRHDVDRPCLLMKSASHNGKSSPVEFVNLARENSVMVFGANLSRGASSALNLFPSSTVEEEEEECNNG